MPFINERGYLESGPAPPGVRPLSSAEVERFFDVRPQLPYLPHMQYYPVPPSNRPWRVREWLERRAGMLDDLAEARRERIGRVRRWNAFVERFNANLARSPYVRFMDPGRVQRLANREFPTNPPRWFR